MEKNNKFKAKIFRALSDPARLNILDFLRDGEKCVCEIIPHVKLIQPVVSRHLKILKESGILRDRKDGNRRLYSVTDQSIFKVVDDANPEFINTFREKILEQIM
jgi:ArsR family transcriptional regulator